MSDTYEQKAPALVVKKSAAFKPGHIRYGGKGRNSTQMVRDLCAEMDIDPMRFMLTLIKDGVATQVVTEGGKKKRVEVTASLEMRTDLAKHVSKFIYPTLTAKEISGPDGGPVESASVHLDINKLLQSPEAIDAAQTLALILARPDNPAPALPGRTVEAESQPVRHPMTYERHEQ